MVEANTKDIMDICVAYLEKVPNASISGMFKRIRRMNRFNLVEDYLVLMEIAHALKLKDKTRKRDSVHHAMRYFEDEYNGSERIQIVDDFIGVTG